MSPRRRMTDEQLAEILRLREEGRSVQRISRKMGFSPGAIAWQCLINGADPPKVRTLSQTAPGPAVVQRGTHVVRHFTPAEDELITRLAIEGVPKAEIGRRINRRTNSITGRLATLARHAERSSS